VNTINEIIRYASIFSIAIPLLFYLFRIKSLSKSSHAIGILVIISAVLDATGAFLFMKGISSTLVSNIYGLLLFFLLCWFYYELFVKKSNGHNYKIIFFLGIVLYVVCLIITLSGQSIFQYQGLLRSFSGIIIIVYSVAFFFYLFEVEPIAPLQLRRSLWFVCGTMFYFVASIGVFVVFRYILANTESSILKTIWSIHNVANIVKNISFAIGFYYTAKLIDIN
jgi:hypothetical protein